MTKQEMIQMGDVIADRLTGSIADNAREIGISRQYLTNIIKGRKVPSGDIMLRLQKHFDLSADNLLPHNNN